MGMWINAAGHHQFPLGRDPGHFIRNRQPDRRNFTVMDGNIALDNAIRGHDLTITNHHIHAEGRQSRRSIGRYRRGAGPL